MSGSGVGSSPSLNQAKPSSSSPAASQEYGPSQEKPLAPPDADSTDNPLEEEPRRPLSFSPFFTLVEDATTSEHHHPNVYYIFSDDDTDPLTEASLRALSPPAPSRIPSLSSSQRSQPRDSNRDSDGSRASQSRSLPTADTAVTERVLLVDVGAGGDTITSVRSLSSDWQVLNAVLSNAPTWDAGDESTDKQMGGLMLRIEGTRSIGPWSGDKDVERGAAGGQGVQDLVGLFEKRMATLRKLREAADKTARPG